MVLWVPGVLRSKEDYSDQKGTQQRVCSSPKDSLKRMAEILLWRKNPFQMNTHAIGDAANRAVLGSLQSGTRIKQKIPRWRIEHAQVIAARGLSHDFNDQNHSLHVQPTHATSDMTWAVAIV